MSTSNINIRVDSLSLNKNLKPKNLDEIQIEISLQRDQIFKVNQQICRLTGQSQAPFLFIQFPSLIDISEFVLHEKQAHHEALYECRHIVNNSKHYYCGNFKSDSTKKFVKNLQKAFIKLNEIQNWIKVSISLPDIQDKKHKSHLWENVTINGKSKIDTKFVPLLKQLLSKVSPKFIDSPIVILLQQLQSIDLDLSLISFELPQFIEELIKKYFGIDLLKNKSLIQKIRASQQKILINLTLGQLFSIKIKGSAFLYLLALI